MASRIEQLLMRTQAQKAAAFRRLHERDGAFIIPNPWDIGSARLLQHLGFEALATTSAGYAFSLGRRDNAVGRELMLEHVRSITAATDIPVSADLENGFGDAPEKVAETFRSASRAELAGGSIEDATGRPDQPLYELELSTERVRAAVEVVRSLPSDFILTARAENFLVGRTDLHDAIRRLQAYQEAGADVLYAPGLASEEEIRAVTSSVDRPVNVLVGPGVEWNLCDLAEMGVKRVSVGSALSRVALGAFLVSAREMCDSGTFAWPAETVSFKELTSIFDA